MCDSVVSKDALLIVWCPNKYITQRMCNEAFDDSLAVLKSIPDWCVTSKMINFLNFYCFGYRWKYTIF